jgi:hypothetical protein
MTAVPRWLDDHWLGQVPATLLTGSLEERAERILEIVQAEQRALADKQTIKANLLKALALDLAAAAAEQKSWPRSIERLLVYAMNVPGKLAEAHESGRWHPWTLRKRGRPPSDAKTAAGMIDSWCYRYTGKVKSQHALARLLRTEGGFKTVQARIREWRAAAYGYEPGTTMYVPPDAPTMTRAEEGKVPPFDVWRSR